MMKFDESSFNNQTFQCIKKSKVHRRLFPEYDNKSNNNNEHIFDVKKMLDEIYEHKKAQWNFDFVAGIPIEGPNSNYSYTEVSSDKMPSFYHTKEYIATPKTPKKQWPLKTRHRLEDEEADNGFFDDEQENHSPHKFVNLKTKQQPLYNMVLEDELNISNSSLSNNSTSSSISSSSTGSFFKSTQNLHRHMPSRACVSDDEAQCSNQQILPQTTHKLFSPKNTKKFVKAKSSSRNKITKTTKKSPTISLNGKIFFIEYFYDNFLF